MAEFPANISLGALNGTDGFKLSGTTFNGRNGYSVSSAGDVNGDGFSDVIVGAPSLRSPNPSASYVVFGHGGAFPANVDLGALSGQDGFRLSAAETRDYAGVSVSAAGDVNGDGFADVIVGASQASPNGNTYSGASYVVFGHDGSFAANINLGALSGTDGFRLSGAARSNRSGFSVSNAGDINGDGFGDLIVGTKQTGVPGASYVVFGHGGGFAADLNLGALNGSNGFRLSGAGARDYSGRSVSAAGDVNGDGFADLIVSSPYADANGADSGASYVVFGHSGAFASDVGLGALDGTTGFKLSGAAADDHSGHSVSNAGDINGDGFADLIVGADRANSSSGASYVVFGHGGPFAANLNLGALDGMNGFTLPGQASGDFGGNSVSGAGDVNGDGFDDLIVGAPGADPNGSSSGASYVVFGHAGAFAATLDLGALDGTNGFKLPGVAGNNLSGYSVSAAGDVNGDGFADVIVGAIRADGNTGQSGASYVVFGRAPDSARTRTGTEVGNEIQGGAFADTLDGAGGNDVLEGRGGGDALNGGAGVRDVASYEHAGAAVTADLAAPGGNTGDGAGDTYTGIESLRGSRFADTLRGDSGNNVIDGGLGADTMAGGAGADVYHVDDAGDVVTEAAGGGADTIVTTITLTLSDEIERLTLGGSADLDGTGNAIGNLMNGNGGANELFGLAGNDKLFGFAGSDRLDGGVGSDLLTGGDGADVFVFASRADSINGVLRDRILDFEQGIDTIDLSGFDANTKAAGVQDFTILAANAAFSGAGGELRFVTLGGVYVVQGDTDGDKQGDFEIAVTSHDGSPLSLQASDFLI